RCVRDIGGLGVLETREIAEETGNHDARLLGLRAGFLCASHVAQAMRERICVLEVRESVIDRGDRCNFGRRCTFRAAESTLQAVGRVPKLAKFTERYGISIGEIGGRGLNLSRHDVRIVRGLLRGSEYALQLTGHVAGASP